MQADVPSGKLLENIWLDALSIVKAIYVAKEEEVVPILADIMTVYEKFHTGQLTMEVQYDYYGGKYNEHICFNRI